MTEKEIQNYIWEHKEEFEKFLQPIEFPEKPVKSPWEYSPTEILYYHIIDKYKAIWEAVQSIDFLGCEVPLKKEGGGSVDALFAECLADVPAEVHQVNTFQSRINLYGRYFA